MTTFPSPLLAFAALTTVGLAITSAPVFAQEPSSEAGTSPRRTETVRLIERCLPAVVAIRSFRPHENPGVFYVSAGSGSVIHSQGYLLTNWHVVRDAVRSDVLFSDGRQYTLRVVAPLRHEDLAVVKIDAPGPLPTLPLGRSHDLMLGEPVMVIGNPGGLAHSVSTGVVSGLNRSTATQDAFLPWTIQTSAAVSGGNSGGPLINALGEQIGVITSKKSDAENINFAIAIDRVREMLPHMIAAEQRYAFWLGLEVDTLQPVARVAKVAAASPAEEAGVQVGDILQKAGELKLHDGVDFHLALIDRRAGQTLPLTLARGEETLSVSVPLAELKLAEPVVEEHVVSGLHFAVYEGMWQKLPDFGMLKPVTEGKATVATLAAAGRSGDFFGVRFTGLVRIPRDGLYTFYTRSDDGSQLRLAGQLVVDNDGLHPPRESGGLVRLKKGLHPIEITCFEANGEEVLEVFWEGPNLERQALSADVLFVMEAK